MKMKSTLILLSLFVFGCCKIVVYEADDDDCVGLLYAEVHTLELDSSTSIDLTTFSDTANKSCSVTSSTGAGRKFEISYGDLSDVVKSAKLSYSFYAKATGYWNSDKVTLTYNNGTEDKTYTGSFTQVTSVSKSFSFACSIFTKIELSSSDNETATVAMDRYQIQVYGVLSNKFAESFQCIGYISKGAWMGIVSGVLMIVVLAMSIMMLMSTSTPDRFETSKSKCLIIPHEH